MDLQIIPNLEIRILIQLFLYVQNDILFGGIFVAIIHYNNRLKRFWRQGESIMSMSGTLHNGPHFCPSDSLTSHYNASRDDMCIGKQLYIPLRLCPVDSVQCGIFVRRSAFIVSGRWSSLFQPITLIYRSSTLPRSLKYVKNNVNHIYHDHHIICDKSFFEPLIIGLISYKTTISYALQILNVKHLYNHFRCRVLSFLFFSISKFLTWIRLNDGG